MVGVLGGYLADLALSDPKRGHPVAVFGRAAAKLELLTYRDSRIAGVAHVGLLVGAVSLFGVAVQRAAGRRGRLCSIAATATAAWISLGGTSLVRTGVQMSELLDRDDVVAARRLLPSLCGRDPARLDSQGLTRAIGVDRGEHVGCAGGADAVGDGRRNTRGADLPRHQHPGFDDRPPLTAVSPVRLGRSAIG
jgi:cobalamin biosynthesis protein CobD/CbiB